MNRFSTYILLLVIVVTGISAAQVVATGTPPFSSIAGGPFDAVNLGNLNVHFVIPILHKGGRGMSFDYYLTYDSSVWYPVGSTGNQSWQPVNSWGWSSSWTGATGYITNTNSGPVYCYDSNGHPIGATTTVSNWVYHDPWGVNHAFSGQIVSSTCPGVQNIPSFTSVAGDGSGLTMNIGTSLPVIVTRAGTGLYPPQGLPSSPSSTTKTDSNGNQITSNGSGQFFDTLSSPSPVLTVSSVSAMLLWTISNWRTAASIASHMNTLRDHALPCPGLTKDIV